jgi:hypothetical protein
MLLVSRFFRNALPIDKRPILVNVTDRYDLPWELKKPGNFDIL